MPKSDAATIAERAPHALSECKIKRRFVQEVEDRLRRLTYEERVIKLEKMLTASVKLIASGVRTDPWIFKAMKWEGEMLAELQRKK